MNKGILVFVIIVAAALGLFLLTGNSDDAQNNAQTAEGSESPAELVDLSAEEFKQKVGEEPGLVIDVRTEEEYQEGHLAQTDYHYDFLNGDFQANLANLDKDQSYYLYCRTGNRSGKAAEIMKENGFNRVYNIGGFEDLVNSGLKSEQ